VTGAQVACHESMLNCLQSIGFRVARHANSDNALLHFVEGPEPHEIYLRVGYEIAAQRDASIYGLRKEGRWAQLNFLADSSTFGERAFTKIAKSKSKSKSQRIIVKFPNFLVWIYYLFHSAKSAFAFFF